MNREYREALIKAALTPADEVRPPVALADDIHRGLLRTAQRGRPPIAAPGLRWLPAVSGALLWLLLLAGLAVAIALAALLLRPGPDEPRAILTYHGDAARTGIMQGPGIVGQPGIAWEVSLDGPLGSLDMPLVADSTIYVADQGGGVSALDVDTGAERWKTSVQSPTGGTPLVSDGLLIVASEDGTVTGFDMTTGAVRWTQPIGAQAKASLGGAGDLVLVGSDDGSIHALDARTGEPAWAVSAGGPVVRAPAIADWVGYVGSSDGLVTAFDARTGHVRWSKDLGAGEVATPAVSDGVLYLAHGVPGAASRYRLLALDTVTGHQKWAWQPPSMERLFVGSIADGTVYATSGDANVYAIDAAAGLGDLFLATTARIDALTTFVDGVLYVSSTDRTIYAVDVATRETLWQQAVTGAPTSPVVVGGRMIVGTDLGKVITIVGDVVAESPS